MRLMTAKNISDGLQAAFGMGYVTAKEKQEEKVGTKGYRADIDGLRAIAVVLVVAFHAFPSLVRGGFVGVDVFSS